MKVKRNERKSLHSTIRRRKRNNQEEGKTEQKSVRAFLDLLFASCDHAGGY